MSTPHRAALALHHFVYLQSPPNARPGSYKSQKHQSRTNESRRFHVRLSFIKHPNFSMLARWLSSTEQSLSFSPLPGTPATARTGTTVECPPIPAADTALPTRGVRSSGTRGLSHSSPPKYCGSTRSGSSSWNLALKGCNILPHPAQAPKPYAVVGSLRSRSDTTRETYVCT